MPSSLGGRLCWVHVHSQGPWGILIFFTKAVRQHRTAVLRIFLLFNTGTLEIPYREIL